MNVLITAHQKEALFDILLAQYFDVPVMFEMTS